MRNKVVILIYKAAFVRNSDSYEKLQQLSGIIFFYSWDNCEVIVRYIVAFMGNTDSYE